MKNERFPTIAAEAKSSGAEILFRDESGFLSDAVYSQTQVAERPGQLQSISHQCQKSFLVRHLPEWFDKGVFCRVAAENDAPAQPASASGCRWITGA